MPRCRGFAVFTAALLAASAVGCGRSAVEVKCKVTHDGKPVGNCSVKLVEDVEDFDPTRHGVGYGYTDANGECEIAHQMTGAKGLAPGVYRVTFEAWKNRSGKEVPPTEKPSEVEGGVIDRLPQAYKSIGSTPERFTVGKSGPITHEFKLTGK